MKKTLKIFILCLFTGVVLLQANDKIIDEVIWVVGDEAILKSDVERQIQQMKLERVDLEGDPRCMVPEQLAVRKLFLHQAQLDSLVVSDLSVSMQVNQRIDDILAQLGSEERMESYFGKTMKQVREELTSQAREQGLIQQEQQKLVSHIKITPSDVQQYFAGREDELPTIPAKVEVQILTIDPGYSTKQIEEIKERLRGYKERVETEDASFSMLATLYSDDPGSAKNGGELGYMGKAQLVPEFANEAFSLTDPKKVSRVIQSEYGFHIIQLVDKKGDRANFRHILIKPKVEIEEKIKATQKLDSIRNLITADKLSFENAVLVFSDDKDTRMNGGVMINQQDGTTRIEYNALPSEISRLAYTMSVGEVSKPITVTQNGKEVCAIIKIKNKIDEHKANIQDDYPQMKAVVQGQKNNEVIEAWIIKKQAETYVRINPNWENCEFHYPNWVKKQ